MVSERSLTPGFPEAALVPTLLHFAATGLSLVTGSGPGPVSSLLFWGSYTVIVFAVVYLVRRFMGGWAS